jgi:hypothetical protein
MANLETIDNQAGPNSASLTALKTSIASDGTFRQNLINFMVAAKMANQHVSQGKTSASWTANFNTVSQKDAATYSTITYRTLNNLFGFSSMLLVTNATGITNASKLAIQYQNALNKRNDYRGRGLPCLPPLPW